MNVIGDVVITDSVIVNNTAPGNLNLPGGGGIYAEAASPVRLVRPWPDHFLADIGLVPRLQRQSEDKTIGPGVPRRLAFPLRVCVSRNRARSVASGSGARRGPTGLP